jgi:AcrR family transcriptional regulator
METALTTRDRLLEAAISIIEAQGEGAIRVDQVAELAGFTKPVLYSYFKNREELIVTALGERYIRALELGRADVDAAVLNASTADEFFMIMQSWVRSFSSPDGELRRRFRIEVVGAAVTREKLQEKIREANRTQAKNLGALIQIAKDRQWLALDATSEDLSMWWTGVVLSRHLVEMDPIGLDADAWDDITIAMMRSMIRVSNA